MTESLKLKPATEMVKANNAHVLNESKAYRQARDVGRTGIRSWTINDGPLRK